ncbi:hypothetical protein OA848_00355 [Rickettsiales bacterium]|nr:hypothetical protein [Rickettsiales bacterium]
MIDNISIRNLFKYVKIKYISNKFGFTISVKNKIGRLYFDSSYINSELCALGKKYGTDKSPYNKELHRQAYTAFYSLIFSSLKNKKIYFAEIGILNNASIKMWKKFFPYAIIYGFEFFDRYILAAKKDKLKEVFYQKIDVKKRSSIGSTFRKLKKKFNIIIDDSTHQFNDQINVIKEVIPFLETGGYLVIEDIPINDKSFTEDIFYEKLKNELKFFDFISFIDCNHIIRCSKGSNNTRLLILIRNKEKFFSSNIN